LVVDNPEYNRPTNGVIIITRDTLKIRKLIEANPLSEKGVGAVLPPVPEANAFGIKEELISIVFV
jgi:hypothetical protein